MSIVQQACKRACPTLSHVIHCPWYAHRGGTLQSQLIDTLQAWALTVLIYPGLLFGVALALMGEWAYNALRPSLAPHILRPQARAYHLAQPLYDFLKMAGRQPSAGAALQPVARSDRWIRSTLTLTSALGPVLALVLLPFPGSPITGAVGPVGDLFLVLALLALYPLCKAILRLNRDTTALRGARDLGRLVTGLFPTLVAVAALLEVSVSRSLQISSLTAAPETPVQTLVRVLSGSALLVALPWWLDWRGSDAEARESAGTYAGKFLQRAALAAFWASIVLPAPGDLPWAIAAGVGGALAAYVAIQAISDRWATGAHERDAARLVWVTSLPIAAVAMLAALVWSGA
jgi:hypothetical protein